MLKEIVSDKQGFCLVTMLMIGTSILYLLGIEAERDLWLSTLLAIILTLPIALILIRLHHLFPGKDLYEMFQTCFGQIIGNILCVLYLWFFLHHSAEVLRNFATFINIVSFPETPLIVPMTSILLLCVWIVKQGIETLGRWTSFFVPIVIVSIAIPLVLLLPQMDIKQVLPIAEHGIKPIAKGAFSAIMFPLSELIVFTAIFSDLKTKKSSYKIYIPGLVVGGMIIFASSTASILVMGAPIASEVYYPFYTTVATINMGPLLQRVEIVVGSVFTLSIFMKSSLYLLAVTRGIAKLFRYNDYRFLVLPTALLMLNLSYLLHGKNSLAFLQWIFAIWQYYTFPFHILLPIALWITAEIKCRKT